MGGLEYEATLEEGSLVVGHRLYPGLNIIVMRYSRPSRVMLRASGAISIVPIVQVKVSLSS